MLLTDYENLYNRLEKRVGDGTAPSKNFNHFITEAKELFAAKSTDYDDRFLRALIGLDARTIWTWEVDKKIDRLRSWIKRGELQVKGEGIRNSVDDLFIYTVQYVAYVQLVVNDGMHPLDFLEAVQTDRKQFFYNFAVKLKAEEWVEFLETKGRITKNEKLLSGVILSYMGETIDITYWQQAIKIMLTTS